MIEKMNLKQELQEYLFNLLIPLEKHYIEDSTGLNLGGFAAGYGIKIGQMEGVSRVLWGLTPLWKGGVPWNQMKDIYLEAVIQGTDRKSPSYWGDITDRDQRIVEMAAISLNFLMTPEIIWHKLTPNQKDNVSKWINQINSKIIPDNNWHFFKVIANVAMKKLGMPYDQSTIEIGINRYEAYYLGNGWYSDGERPQIDYYTSFGIHFYSLLYATYMKDEDPEQCKIYIDRAHVFAETFTYWFDDFGRGIPFGRSQTYRFAQVAFWSIFVTITEDRHWLQVGKGHLRKNFEFWMKQPIMDNDGVLTVGYAYPNLLMSEGYNSPGSPYWAFKSFFCLSLPDEHPFWNIEEITVEDKTTPRLLPECKMLIQSNQSFTTALTSGQYPTVPHTHAAEKYSKFAYNTLFGFSVPRSMLSLEENAPDNMLAFRIKGIIFVRHQVLEVELSETYIRSVWSPYEGIMVETTLIPTNTGHRRIHKVNSLIDCEAFDCGFAFPFTQETRLVEDQGYCEIKDSNGYSSIGSKHGFSKVIRSVPNTNLMFPLTAIPAIRYLIKKGNQEFESETYIKFRPGHIIIGRGDCYEYE